MTTTVAAVVSVEDLRRAYRAAAAGEFRNPRRTRSLPAEPPPDGPAPAAWSPGTGERIVLVIGACSGAGASTVALGLASCAGAARVVECCTVAASGLAAASSAEMGVTADGWVQGTRDAVLVERRPDRVPSLAAMPAPSASTRPVTVIDCAGDADLLLASPGWLGELARTSPCVVVVSRASGPGLRRLETAVGLFGVGRVHGVVVGAPKRWPRQLEHQLGPHIRQLRAESRLASVPLDSRIAAEGITTDPLPAALLAAVSPLLESLEGTSQ